MEQLAARAGCVLQGALKETLETYALASPTLRMNMWLKSEILEGQSKRLCMDLLVLK